ncbi:MAG: hypothetical protein Q7T16_05190 [Candidatus Burarchaeum sp.]|nr:hypothetical protein [Candidatus Burarchaeum sp.]MDO8340024.1 hypothetical protein [Candidatus Burarchaeum sp.]
MGMVLQASLLEEVVDLLGQGRSLDRLGLEQRVRELDISEASVERYLGGADSASPRKIIARNELMECMFREWPSGSEMSFSARNRNEVVRVLSGKLTLTEQYCAKGRMEPYCMTALIAGSVVSLPENLFYKIQNRQRDAARTLHFVRPPRGGTR